MKWVLLLSFVLDAPFCASVAMKGGRFKPASEYVAASVISVMFASWLWWGSGLFG